MMMRSCKVFILLFFSVIQVCCGQADIHLSQFYESAIIRNPALTGVFADDYKVSCFYRSQWASVSNPYTTILFSGATKVAVGTYSDDFMSFGLLGYRDKAGTAGQQITSVYPALSFNKSLNPNRNSYLSFGAAGAYSQYSFDPGKITFNNQYENGIINASLPTFENIATTRNTFWNLAAGVNYNTSNNEDNTIVYCVGMSGYNLIEKPLAYLRQSNSKLNFRGNVNGAIAMELREDINIQFHGNYAHQGKYNEVTGAFLWTWTPVNRYYETEFALTIGGVYRHNDAVAPVVRMKYKTATVSASYDVNISTFQPATNLRGGLELALSVAGQYNNRNGKGKTTVCPRF